VPVDAGNRDRPAHAPAGGGKERDRHTHEKREHSLTGRSQYWPRRRLAPPLRLLPAFRHALTYRHRPLRRRAPAFDAALCLAFFVQHSGMIRRGAKRCLAKRIPSIYHPALYSITSGASFPLSCLRGSRPPASLPSSGSRSLLSAGTRLARRCRFHLGVHSLREFDPFGTRHSRRLRAEPPALLYLRGFVVPIATCAIRYTCSCCCSSGRLLASRPTSPLQRLWSAWIVFGTRLEERDLLVDFDQTYREYQASVPCSYFTPGRAPPAVGAQVHVLRRHVIPSLDDPWPRS